MKQTFDLGHSARVQDRDRRAVRRQFDRRTAWPDPADFLLREVSARMLDRLDLIRLQPEFIVDVGCGFGEDVRALWKRHPSARLLGIDLALGRLSVADRLDRAARERPWWQALTRRFRGEADPSGWPTWVCADTHALPVSSHQADLIWSNLVLHWSDDVPTLMGEWHRVIRPGGLIMFSVLGVDTLRELSPLGLTLPALPDLHDLGDALVQAGFADPVMDAERLQLTWQDPQRMLEDLRALGGDVRPNRSIGLATARSRASLLDRLQRLCGPRPTPITVEIIQGHAWCPPAKRLPQGWSPVSFRPRPTGPA